MIAESSNDAIDLELTYQGPGYATEIWGVIQANFMLAIRGESLREMAVNVGPPVAAFVAAQAGREDTPAFRDEIARALGQCRVNQLHARGHQIDSVETISMDLLNREPELLACALAELNRV
ncbi:hypothetical protein J0H33_13400 [bacterium]|jgi:hypothetical protein|nr:hypothetical protein [bacterium]